MSAESEATYGLLYVAIDVNGWRTKPNRYGYDFFVFQLLENGRLLPMGDETSNYPETTYCSKTSTDAKNGFGCTIKAFTDSRYFSRL